MKGCSPGIPRFARDEGPSETHVLVSDPPQAEGSDPVYADPVRAWQVAYARAFRFIGLETAADQVLRGDPVTAIRALGFDRERDWRRSERDLRRLSRAAAARQ